MIISITSKKGGVGKSTLAIGLAGALADIASTVVVDEDVQVHSCLDWATAGERKLPFAVVTADEAEEHVATVQHAVIDTEGRPELADMAELTRHSDAVLIPTGPSGLDVRSTIELWHLLAQAGANMSRVWVVITKAPPVGTVGQQARDALREMDVQVCNTVVRAYTAHQRAAEQGLLVRDVRDSRAAPAWADVQMLAQEITA